MIDSDLATAAAYLAFVADHNRPECRCQVQITHHPATPENRAIRDMTEIRTDARDCPIERHRYPFGAPRSAEPTSGGTT